MFWRTQAKKIVQHNSNEKVDVSETPIVDSFNDEDFQKSDIEFET